MRRILEWIELPDGGPPDERESPFPGDCSVWFRIVTDGEPGRWQESSSQKGVDFLRDARDWWPADDVRAVRLQDLVPVARSG